MLIGGRQQEAEVRQRDALGGVARLAAARQDDLLLVQGEIQGGLILGTEFVGLVHKHDRTIGRRKQNSMQIRGMLDALPQDFEVIAGHFSGDHLGDTRLAQSGRPHKQGVLEGSGIHLGGIERHAHLIDDTPLPDDMVQRGRLHVIDFTGEFAHPMLLSRA